MIQYITLVLVLSLHIFAIVWYRKLAKIERDLIQCLALVAKEFPEVHGFRMFRLSSADMDLHLGQANDGQMPAPLGVNTYKK